MLAMKTLDYYEFLQISPNADHETIHRVYRFLAARYHPDNPKSGDVDKFSMLKDAYDVLSDPERRAEYDMEREAEPHQVAPLSANIDFMDQIEGEINRRLALLAVLYYRRRNNPYAPEVPLAEVERRMGFPRDYLDFTTWYLEKKGYIARADNSDFTLTAAGVDFVESERTNIPVITRLLTDGAEVKPSAAAEVKQAAAAAHDAGHKLTDVEHHGDRRASRKDRRHGAPDTRPNPVDRRINRPDRRLAS
ncbi:MAG: J domain-containing protein [Acidobacteriota bacterium]|nr:J domain-containing protein [Acidobacteriota bacterium]